MSLVDERKKLFSSLFSDVKNVADVLPQRDCTLCQYSEFKGVVCKLVDPPRRLASTKEAQICLKYTPIASDEATVAAVQKVEDKTDSVAAVVAQVKSSVDALKGSSSKTFTDVQTELGNVKTEIEGVQVAVASVDSKTDLVKSSILDTLTPAVNAVKNAVDSVKSSTDAVTNAANNIKSSTDLVKTATDAVKNATDTVKNAVDTMRAMVARPVWYDRNPFSVVRKYETTGLLPHSLTERWNYTVPSGKKAMVEAACVEIIRQVQAGVAGLQYIVIAVQPSGGSSTDIVRASLFTAASTSKLQNISILSQSILLVAGDVLRCLTYDGSYGGGGDSYYYGAAKITEFDA